jgi:hypothetical protein
MSSDYEAVTDGQLEHIRNEARKKGVDSAVFQLGIDRGVFDRALDKAGKEYQRVHPAAILFTVTSDGRSFDEVIASIEAKGRRISDWAKNLVLRSGEKTTTGVVYNFVGIRGDEFPTYRERTMENIFAEAKRRKYPTPTVESTLLLREKYSQNELEKTGLRCFPVFHEPVRYADDCPYYVLVLYRTSDGGWLDGWDANPTRPWHHERLFLFLAPQMPRS